MVMGVSMSKSDNSFSEDSGSIYIKDVVPQTDVSEIEESEQTRTLASRSEAINDEGESEVIQVLCPEDDDNEDLGWKDIYERLRSNKNLDLHVTNKNARPSGPSIHTKTAIGPIFTSSVNARSTRINSANFNPHAVVLNSGDSSSQSKISVLQEDTKADDEFVQTEEDIRQYSRLSNPKFEELDEDTKSSLVSSKETIEGFASPVAPTNIIDTPSYLLDEDYDDTQNIEVLNTLKEHSNVSINIEETEETVKDGKISDANGDDLMANSGKDFLTPRYSSASNYVDDNWDPFEGLGFPRERTSSFGSASIVSVKDFRDELYNEYFYEVRRFIRNFGYFEKFPSPCLLRDAQRTYRQLNLPTPIDDDGRILPHPPKQTRDTVFGAQDFADVDQRAIFAPENLNEKCLAETAAHLCSGLDDDVQKIRAIYTWFTQRQMLLENTKKTEKREVYCKAFRKLCRCARIQTKLVHGIIRGGSYLPGEDLEKFRGCWVSILVNNTWWVLDPVLTVGRDNNCIHTSIIKRASLPEIETRSDLEPTDSGGFFREPEEFIFSHFPDADYWQLLARPVSRDELTDLAVLGEGYFRLRIKLLNHDRSVVLVENESVVISLGFPENAQRQFMCKLFYCKDTSLESETVTIDGNQVSLRQYVFLETNLEKCRVNILIRFPRTGSYMLNIYGDGGSVSETLHICSYRLVYSNPKCSSPFPQINREEWGPGLDALTLGLSPISHKTGEIIIDQKVMQIAFQDLRRLQFKYDLREDGQLVDRENIKLSFLRNEEEDIVFVIDMEPNVTGVFVLNLYAKPKSNKPFYNFCTYLLRKFECCSDWRISDKDSNKKVKTSLYGYRSVHQTKEIVINEAPDIGQLQVTVDTSEVSKLRVELKLQGKQELNFSEHTRHWITDQTGYVDVNFPRAGQYKLRVLGRCKLTNHFKTLFEENIRVTIPSSKWSSFPKALDEWNSYYKLEEPLTLHLEEKANVKFQLIINGALDVAFLAANGWYHLENDDGLWTGTVWTGPKSTRARLLARFELGSEKFSELLMFKVMSKEDLELLDERQEIMRKGALARASNTI